MKSRFCNVSFGREWVNGQLLQHISREALGRCVLRAGLKKKYIYARARENRLADKIRLGQEREREELTSYRACSRIKYICTIDPSNIILFLSAAPPRDRPLPLSAVPLWTFLSLTLLAISFSLIRERKEKFPSSITVARALQSSAAELADLHVCIYTHIDICPHDNVDVIIRLSRARWERKKVLRAPGYGCVWDTYTCI